MLRWARPSQDTRTGKGVDAEKVASEACLHGRDDPKAACPSARLPRA